MPVLTFSVKASFSQYWKMQIPIKAGYEFIITTDPKYAECCDDKYMYVDYVRTDCLRLSEVDRTK